MQLPTKRRSLMTKIERCCYDDAQEEEEEEALESLSRCSVVVVMLCYVMFYTTPIVVKHRTIIHLHRIKPLRWILLH